MAVIVRAVSPELYFCLAMSTSCPIASTCLILHYSQRCLLQLCVFSGVNINAGESQRVL